MGLGVALYYKFMKFWALVFLLMSLLVLPSILVYWCDAARQR